MKKKISSKQFEVILNWFYIIIPKIVSDIISTV